MLSEPKKLSPPCVQLEVHKGEWVTTYILDFSSTHALYKVLCVMKPFVHKHT